MFTMLSRVTVAFALAAFACSSSPSRPAPPAPVAAAEAAAQSWLALVDQRKYDASWNAAASLFKTAVSEEQWDSAVASVREPLGKLVSRQLKSAEFKTALPGAPSGKYVVIRFDATFANSATAVETITPMQEADGSWKVSGYFINRSSAGTSL